MDDVREAQDKPTTTVFTDEEQAPEAWYSWQFTPAPGEPTQVFEFGMAMPEIDAANKIAKYLGVETLPDGYKLEHPEISPLEARLIARDAAPYELVEKMPSTPEPVGGDGDGDGFQIHDPNT